MYNRDTVRLFDGHTSIFIMKREGISSPGADLGPFKGDWNWGKVAFIRKQKKYSIRGPIHFWFPRYLFLIFVEPSFWNCPKNDMKMRKTRRNWLVLRFKQHFARIFNKTPLQSVWMVMRGPCEWLIKGGGGWGDRPTRPILNPPLIIPHRPYNTWVGDNIGGIL